MRRQNAFTLIEMLVVIAIIGIIAGLVVSAAGHAKVKQRMAQVDAGARSIRLAIDSYQSKLNFFPPDNGALVNNAFNFPVYDAMAATNGLLYELTGATNNPNGSSGKIQVFGTNMPIQASAYSNLFNRSSVNNANPDELHSYFYPKPSEYAPYDNVTGLLGLTVPVPATNSPTAGANFWHYDASTTNRHNMGSYDLWAEFVIGHNSSGDIIYTNGNWR